MEANGRSATHVFWQAVEHATDPTIYRPKRRDGVEVVRLQNDEETYYVLKQPETKSYIRLSESDYSLYWQMDGGRSIKELLGYCVRRYKTLPIGHLNRLIDELKVGGFLEDRPVNLYQQLRNALEARASGKRGRRLLNAFLHSEWSMGGLDDFFEPLYRQTRWLYSVLGQLLLFLVVVIGGYFFSRFFLSREVELTAQGAISIVTLFFANLVVIVVHELAHGLTVKHFGRHLDRGGFLFYWGFPAFFVDTRDIWMLDRHKRLGVVWAGPYSGLLLGGLAGLALTAVNTPSFNLNLPQIWFTFIYQIGFIAYFSAIFNLNPLLELDGYFMLMDWLEMPGLRDRAFRFWREAVWQRLRKEKTIGRFWQSLERSERTFLLYGGLAFLYSVYAVLLAIYFWQTRISGFLRTAWQHSVAGQIFVLFLTAAILGPTVYYLLQYGWYRVQLGLEWLANRNLLSRPDVLAFLVGVPLLTLIGAIRLGLEFYSFATVWSDLLVWLAYLGTAASFVVIARQLPGSEFQWTIWAMATVPVLLTLAWLTANSSALWLPDLFLMLYTVVLIAAGFAAWLTVSPEFLDFSDNLVMGTAIIAAPLSYFLATFFYAEQFAVGWWRWLTTAVLHYGLFLSLMYMAPLLINFKGSRFGLSWFLITLVMLLTPWVQFEPWLHLPVAALWLFATLHYLLVGELARFARVAIDEETAVYDDRSRLVEAFNGFMRALFRSYEAVFGGRRLDVIRAQIQALGVLDPDASILEISERGQQALLLAIDRLDDLAGTPFTHAAGKAAYDSLPWLQAETLARHILSGTEWGANLSSGFIVARDRRVDLVRRADIFAGFDNSGIVATVDIAESWSGRKGVMMASQGEDATKFFLIESGEVAILHDGQQVGTLLPGGYFGANALLDSGTYHFSYRTLKPVQALVIRREMFDPLLRADTTLSKQVSSGARERQLLRQMPLFASLSPQQLATIDARMKHRTVEVDEVIAKQGEARSHLFIIVSGAVDVLVTHEEKVERIGRLGPGEHFGEYALFADTPYHATYKAVVACELLLLDEPKFDELVAECERMSHYVEQIGSGRLVATKRRMGLTAVLS